MNENEDMTVPVPVPQAAPTPDAAHEPTVVVEVAQPEPAHEPTVGAQAAPMAAPYPAYAADPSAATPFPDPAEPKPRRRIKSRSLFAGAVVLGVLGGLATGYAVQSSRPPTPLPALLPAQPSYGPVGVYAGVAPSPLPSSQDDLTVTDGDLTKLLLPTPSGASVGDAWNHQWLGIVDEAALCDGSRQRDCFTSDVSDGIRSLADTGWTTKSGYYEEIRILRFDPDYDTGTYLDDIGYGTALHTPDQFNAKAFAYTDSTDGEHLDFAAATHGDLVVEFWVSSTKHVPNPSLINSLITQQMARL